MAGRIVGPDGEPIDKGALTQEIAVPEAFGVRQLWQPSVAAGLTPEELVAILERSVHHDPWEYLQLAEDMEERDQHYFSVLGTRKLAVESIDVAIEAASEDANDVRIADAVRELFDLECVRDSRVDLLDGLGKSFSVAEIIWDTSGGQWMPQAIKHRHATWFRFDQETGQELRLRDRSDLFNGLPLPPHRFIRHRPRLKTGLPIRNGLARVVAFGWICKAYALKDWVAFAEVFGLPIRVGKYGPSATSKDIATLRRAVVNIGSDAACVIPQSMAIEFQQAGNVGAGANIFERLCDWIDRQTSKCVLGQTMTADAQSTGMNSSNASVHNEVRGDIRDADGDQLASTYQRDLVRPFVSFNFGPQKRYPKVVIRMPRPEDLKQLTESLQVFIPMGLRVEEGTILDKLGLPEPSTDKAARYLTAAAAPAPVADPATPPPEARAMNRRQTLGVLQRLYPDPVEQLVDNLDRRARNAYEQMLAPVVALLESATTMEDVRDGLDRLYPEMPDEELVGLIRDAAASAYLAGREEVSNGR